MLSNEEFVRLSLETNLFFMRIAREHAVFLQNGFTLRDFNLALRAENFKKQFTNLLTETLELSEKILSNTSINYGELVSGFTLQAEKHMVFCTGTDLDMGVTYGILSLKAQNRSTDDKLQNFVDKVVILNERAIITVTSLIEFKERLLYDMLQSRLFMHLHPLLIEHLLEEARIYLEMLFRLQERIRLSSILDMADGEMTWNNLMSEHAKFIQGFLDPSEVELKSRTEFFAKEFDKLTREIRILGERKAFSKQLVMQYLETTNAFQNFTQKITQGILDCRIRASVFPLLIDHFARETKYFARITSSFKKQLKQNMRK